jgi:hypothetical protein
VRKLCSAVKNQVDQISSNGHLTIECEHKETAYILRNGQVGMVIQWNQQHANRLDDSSIFVEEYDKNLRFDTDPSPHVILHQPQLLKRNEYPPDLSRDRVFGWRASKDSQDFITTEALADKCLMQFLASIEREQAGELPHRQSPPRGYRRSTWSHRQ